MPWMTLLLTSKRELTPFRNRDAIQEYQRLGAAPIYLLTSPSFTISIQATMDETMEETTQPPRSCIDQLNHLQEETSTEIYTLLLSRLRPKLKGLRIKSVDQAKQLKREFYKKLPRSTRYIPRYSCEASHTRGRSRGGFGYFNLD